MEKNKGWRRRGNWLRNEENRQETNIEKGNRL